MDEISSTPLRDVELAQRMRNINYEQFKTLVRMHLSFELHLNTDEFDLPSHEVLYYEKGKLRKLNRLSRKIKGCTSAKFGSPAEDVSTILTKDFIQQLRVLKYFLMKEENVKQEGIFRKTGSVSRQNELKSLINHRKEFNVEKGYTVHDCATVYKGFLADLPEPVLTDAHYPAHFQISDLCKDIDSNKSKNCEKHLLHSVQLLLLLLPDENRKLLEDIIDMLHTTVQYGKFNKMTADTLATLFSPHLICPRNLPPEGLHYISQSMSNIIKYMIDKGLVIFNIPSKLATDIRAYFLDQKRKKATQSEKILDESISDISTVNTIYTFVDREKTAEAHNSNPTDTALAQLYAHIQSLPESSKKRKLIKQFNKENGQGTPLQMLMSNRIKNTEIRGAKSIGDSIKRHIFNRGVMSRTPKRSHTPSNFDTPNSGQPVSKLRVLFQSPITPLSCTTTTTTTTTMKNSPLIKNHSLHKSISASSLLTETPPRLELTAESISAPVSRTSSSTSVSLDEESELVSRSEQDDEPDVIEKKSVAFLTESHLHMDLESKEHSALSQDGTSDNSSISNGSCSSITGYKNNSDICSNDVADLKSRYRSEPNLSKFAADTPAFTPEEGKSTSFANRLMKGVSMGNLRFGLSSETTKQLKNSASLLLKRKSSFEAKIETDTGCESMVGGDVFFYHPRIDDTPRRFSSSVGQDLITSTPSLLLGRRSMSPITKSTQRMPKSMQESIMTPRSRKPVMLATIGSLEQGQTGYQNDLLSFREEDEDSILNSELSLKESNRFAYKSNVVNDLENTPTNPKKWSPRQSTDSTFAENISKLSAPRESLTNTFREYLLSRSVLTTSPVDSSFFSQSDDFGSTPDLLELDETDMNASLLYCLNGNPPPTEKANENEVEENDKKKVDNSAVRKMNSISSNVVESIKFGSPNQRFTSDKENIASCNVDENLYLIYNKISGETTL